MKQLRIGLDLDGVLHDYTAGVRQYLSAALGRPLESFPDPTEYRFADLWCPGMPEVDFLAHLHAGVDAGVIFGHGDPIAAGTAAAMQRLLAVGHEVHIVTARSMGSPGAAERVTREWLARHSIGYTSLTLANDKTTVPTDVFVEDYLPNVRALEAAGVTCWLVDRPWNQPTEAEPDQPGRYRVTSVVEAALQIADWALSEEERAAAQEFTARMSQMEKLTRPVGAGGGLSRG